MKNGWNIRNDLYTIDSTTISKATFEKHFFKTSEKVTFTFNGWDGKSYDGETRTAYIYKTDLFGYDTAKFVKVGKSIHCIDEAWMVIEKATGESHPTAVWTVDVARA